jgi:uncharacterized low-complexity protein
MKSKRLTAALLIATALCAVVFARQALTHGTQPHFAVAIEAYTKKALGWAGEGATAGASASLALAKALAGKLGSGRPRPNGST